jgi:hypothetical protein
MIHHPPTRNTKGWLLYGPLNNNRHITQDGMDIAVFQDFQLHDQRTGWYFAFNPDERRVIRHMGSSLGPKTEAMIKEAYEAFTRPDRENHIVAEEAPTPLPPHVVDLMAQGEDICKRWAEQLGFTL